MKSLRRGVIVRIGLLVLALYVIAEWDSFRLEEELQGIAEARTSEAVSYLNDPTAHAASSVVVSRSAIVLGQAHGKITVFVTHGNAEHIEGYEYFFEREDGGQWRQIESGRCSSEQCSIEGRKLLQAMDKVQ